MGTDVETKVSYTIVGIFVIALFAALVAGILWLGGGGDYRKTYDAYLVYMNESVAGLNLNASVKYRGVDVGRVKRISLDHGERVRLDLDIERGTPIKENTVAVLRVQGLTGIAQVELAGGTRDARPLVAKPGEGPPVIKTMPSLLTRLDTAVSESIAGFNQVAQRVDAVLDEENQRAFRQLLANLASLSGTLAARSEAIDAGLLNAARTSENIARTSAEMPRLIERLENSARALEKMAGDASQASVAVRKTMNGVDRAAETLIPELELTLGEIRELGASFRQVSEELGRNPNMLLLGRQPAAPGPGESGGK